MRLRAAFGTTTLLLAGVVGLAAEPKPVTLDLSGSTWTAGEVTSHTGAVSVEQRVEGDGCKKLEDAAFVRSESWSVAVRRAELDESGEVTQAEAFFDGGLLRDRAARDRSVIGVRIRVAEDAWTQEDSLSTPSDGTRAWLTDVFVPKRLPATSLSWIAAAAPEGPVSVGATWRPDMAVLGTRLQDAWGLTFDLDAAKGTCELLAVGERRGVRRARLTVKMSLPVASLPASGEGPAVKPDGPVSLQVSETWDVSLCGDVREASVSSSGDLWTAATCAGEAVQLVFRATARWTTRKGGFIPGARPPEK